MATVADMRNMLGGLDSCPDENITESLSLASDEIVSQGISVGSSSFDRVQKFLTAHYLNLQGWIGRVTASSAQGVNVSYEGSGTIKADYTTDWEREYRKALTAAQGGLSRFLV